MDIRSGSEIVRLHHDIEVKISEIESAITQLAEYGYTQTVLQEQLGKLRSELQTLEATRFQALEPVVIAKSTLGGRGF